MFDPKKPTVQMLGRWQPFHDGHLALFKEALKKTGQVCIMVRDTGGTDDSNPFDFDFVKEKIEEAVKEALEWLDDNQEAEKEEFEAKQKALNEEKEKYRKNLELEMKKLHSEVADICTSYDQKLAEFIETRSRTLEAIFTQELYILRLTLLLLEKEDDAAQLSKLRKERAELIAKKKLADEKLANFRTTVLNSKNDLDRMKATEKQMSDYLDSDRSGRDKLLDKVVGKK